MSTRPPLPPTPEDLFEGLEELHKPIPVRAVPIKTVSPLYSSTTDRNVVVNQQPAILLMDPVVVHERLGSPTQSPTLDALAISSTPDLALERRAAAKAIYTLSDMTDSSVNLRSIDGLNKLAGSSRSLPLPAHMIASGYNSNNPNNEVATSSMSDLAGVETQVNTPDVSTAQAGFVSCYINLMKTIIGSGMLILPLGMSMLGIMPALILLAVASTMSIFGVYLLSMAVSIAGRGATFGSISNLTYPSIAWFFEGVVAIKCTGVAIVYMIVASKLASDLVKQFFANRAPLFIQGTLFWTLVFGVLLAPIVSMRKVDSLKYTSFLGLLSIAYLIGVFTYTAITQDKANMPIGEVHFIAPLRVSSLSALSFFIFALTCHQAVPSIQNEAQDHKPGFIMKVTLAAIGTSTVLYVLFMLVTYLTFGDAIKSNILDLPPQGANRAVRYTIANVLYMFLMLFSLPLLAFPGRAAYCKLVQMSQSEETKARYSTLVYWIVTYGLLGTVVAIAAPAPQMKHVMGFVGGITGPIICFILPGIIYHRITSPKHALLVKEDPPVINQADTGLIVSPSLSMSSDKENQKQQGSSLSSSSLKMPQSSSTVLSGTPSELHRQAILATYSKRWIEISRVLALVLALSGGVIMLSLLTCQILVMVEDMRSR